MTEALRTLWHTAATVAPKVLLFLAILAVGYLAARLIARTVGSLLLRAGFNQLLDKALPQPQALAGTAGNELAAKLTYLAALLVVLQLAFGVFGPNPISSLITSVIAFLPRIAVALALVVVAGLIASKVRDLIAATLGALSYANLLARAAQAFLLALGVIAALSQVGVALSVTMPVLVTVLATLAGIAIVGLGGGLIKPMQARWENYLTNAEHETLKLREPAEPAEPVVHTATVTVTTRELG